MFELAKKRDLESFKQQAALQGIDLNDNKAKGKASGSNGFNEKTKYDDFYGGQKPLLPSADDVAHMTDKEKDDITKKAMANFSRVVGVK